MAYLFIILALLAFCGFAFNAAGRNGHGMVYSAMIAGVWILAALWWTGRI